MKTLELKDRKVTTRKAVEKALEFFGNFDISAAKDVTNIRSEFFPIAFDLTGKGDICDEAAFYNKDGVLKFWLREAERSYNLDTILDDTCVFVNFKEMMRVFEKFIERLNTLIEDKETELIDFLDFVDGYENFLDTVRIAKEVESQEEHI